MVDKDDIKQAIRKTLHGISMWSYEAELLVYETGMVESGYKYLRQIGGGPARSFFQVEALTARDNIHSWIQYRKKAMKNVCNVTHIEPNELINFSENQLYWVLESNIAFAICMCRIKFWRVPKALPKAHDHKGRAEYWLKYYNAGGKGTIKKYLEANSLNKNTPQ